MKSQAGAQAAQSFAAAKEAGPFREKIRKGMETHSQESWLRTQQVATSG
jgi:hypothetical protein